MIFEIVDNETDESMGQITAKTYYDADQEATCFVAENGIDREYDYTGYYIERVL